MQLESSYIYIKGIKLHAFIGVSELERKVGNDYVVNLRLRYNIEKAMLSDDVTDTLNYAEVYEVLKKVMLTPVKLLEHAAHNIEVELGKQFPKIEEIHLQLTKLNPPMGADCYGAGVELHVINEKSHPNFRFSNENA